MTPAILDGLVLAMKIQARASERLSVTLTYNAQLRKSHPVPCHSRDVTAVSATKMSHVFRSGLLIGIGLRAGP
jgi:hypothetical protein